VYVLGVDPAALLRLDVFSLLGLVLAGAIVLRSIPVLVFAPVLAVERDWLLAGEMVGLDLARGTRLVVARPPD
jgi:hypothetical protein